MLLILLLLLVYLEDLVRLLLPNNSFYFLVVKDALLFCIYVVFLTRWVSVGKFLISRTQFLLGFYLCFSFSIGVHSFFLNNVNFLFLLNWARAEIFYAILVFVSPLLLLRNSSREALFKYVYVILFLQFTFAVIQYFDLSAILDWTKINGLRFESLSNQFDANFGEEKIPVLFGISASVTKFGMALFHLGVWLILLFLLSSKDRSHALFLILIIVITIFLLISGKRLPFILWCGFILMTPFLLMFASWNLREFTHNGIFFRRRVNKILHQMWLGIGAMFFLMLLVSLLNTDILVYGSRVLQALTVQFDERFFNSNPLGYFWVSEYKVIIENFGIYGQGVGTSSHGSQYVELITGGSFPYLNVEHGPLKVFLEFGVFGILHFCFFWSVILFIDFKAYIATKRQPVLGSVSLLITLYHLCMFLAFFVAHGYMGDAQILIQFWLLTGFQLFASRLRQVHFNAFEKNSTS